MSNVGSLALVPILTVRLFSADPEGAAEEQWFEDPPDQWHGRRKGLLDISLELFEALYSFAPGAQRSVLRETTIARDKSSLRGKKVLEC